MGLTHFDSSKHENKFSSTFNIKLNKIKWKLEVIEESNKVIYKHVDIHHLKKLKSIHETPHRIKWRNKETNHKKLRILTCGYPNLHIKITSFNSTHTLTILIQNIIIIFIYPSKNIFIYFKKYHLIFFFENSFPTSNWFYIRKII